jgi:hypothetical protein
MRTVICLNGRNHTELSLMQLLTAGNTFCWTISSKINLMKFKMSLKRLFSAGTWLCSSVDRYHTFRGTCCLYLPWRWNRKVPLKVGT